MPALAFKRAGSWNPRVQWGVDQLTEHHQLTQFKTRDTLAPGVWPATFELVLGANLSADLWRGVQKFKRVAKDGCHNLYQFDAFWFQSGFEGCFLLFGGVLLKIPSPRTEAIPVQTHVPPIRGRFPWTGCA